MTVPRSLRVAAAITAIQAFGLVVAGLVLIVRSIVGHPDDRGTAIFLGLICVGWGGFICLAARGLLRLQRWGQTPAYLNLSFAVVLGVFQFGTLPGLALPLIVSGLAGIVVLSWPDARTALGGL